MSHQPVPSAGARVYARIKDEILDGTLATGSFVTEGDLATAAEVSRTPVREALLRLETEGLVRLYPKKGALVVAPTADEVRDVLEAREVIEEWAARAVWPRRAEIVGDLEVELDAMRATRATGDLAALVGHDRRFHEIIVGAPGNAVLARAYHGLRDRQLTIVAAGMRRSETRIHAAVDGHTRLLELLRSGTDADVDAFVAVTVEHVRSAGDTLQGRQ